MKKRFVVLFFSLFFSILIISLINSQTPPESINPVPKTGILEINPNTGLPKSFENFRNSAQNLSDEEKREEYLKQEWTKILAEQAIIGPILYYTNNFFTLFNPLWIIIFGVQFSWSWFFIFSFIMCVGFIIFFYFPVKEFTQLNPIFGLIGAIIIACIMGTTKVIPKTANLLSFAVTNFWKATLALIIFILLIWLYEKTIKTFGKKLKEESEKEELERAQTIIKKTGKLYEKEFDERSR